MSTTSINPDLGTTTTLAPQAKPPVKEAKKEKGTEYVVLRMTDDPHDTWKADSTGIVPSRERTSVRSDEHGKQAVLEELFGLADDFRNLGEEEVHDLLHPPPFLESYVRAMGVLHLHLWIRAGDSDPQTAQYCARYKRALPIGKVEPLRVGAVLDGANVMGELCLDEDGHELSVFVFVRDVAENCERVPSVVRLMPLDECPLGVTQTGESFPVAAGEVRDCVSDGELTVPPGGTLAAFYECVGGVFQCRAQVLDAVAEDRAPDVHRDRLRSDDFKDELCNLVRNVTIELGHRVYRVIVPDEPFLERYEVLMRSDELGFRSIKRRSHGVPSHV